MAGSATLLLALPPAQALALAADETTGDASTEVAGVGPGADTTVGVAAGIAAIGAAGGLILIARRRAT